MEGEEAGRFAPPEPSPSALNRFADTFYSIVVAPRPTLEFLTGPGKRQNGRVAEAAAVVALVSALDGMRLAGSSSAPLLISAAVFGLVSGLIVWLLMLSIPALADYAFRDGRGKTRAFAIASGWCFLPWLFMTPLSLWGSAFGALTNVLIGCVLLAWMVYLFWFALQKTYGFKAREIVCTFIVIPPVIMLLITILPLQLAMQAASLIFG